MVNRDPRAVVRVGGDAGELLDDDYDAVRELRDAIEGSREQVTDSLVLLHDEFDRRTDWRGWVREHPWETVGAAFFVGFLVGSRPYL